MQKRISKIEYAMRIAEVAAQRSEDPFYKVGAVLLNEDGRVLSTGYNGLPAGHSVPHESWWEDKEARKPYVIHAEQNACAMIRYGEAVMACVTLQPCPDCLRMLAAHGIKRVYYRKTHAGSIFSENIATFFNMTFVHFPEDFGDTQEKPPDAPACWASYSVISTSDRQENGCSTCPVKTACMTSPDYVQHL